MSALVARAFLPNLMAVWLMVWLAPYSPAEASPLEDPSLGGAVFTGPTHGHASSFFVNPAALGFSGRGWHLHVGGSGRLDSLWIDRKKLSPTGDTTNGESISNHTLSPGGIIAWYSSFQEHKARFGVSLYTPSYQRFPKGDPAIGFHSEGGQLIQGMLTMAGSYRFDGRLLLGIGFSLGYSAMRLDFSRDSALSGGSDDSTGINSDCEGEACGFENPAAREHYNLDVGSQGLFEGLFALKNISASIGIAYRIRPKIWIALGYVTLPGGFGKLSLSGDARITRSSRDGGAVETGTAEIGFRMAQMVFLGYRMPAFSDLDLVADLRWQDWSRHDQFDIRIFGGDVDESIPEWMPRSRGFHDVWRGSIGLEQRPVNALRLGARIRVESGAVKQSAISAMQVAGQSFTLATGAEYRMSDHWLFNLGYELTWFPGVSVTDSDFDPRDRVACVDSQFHYDSCAAVRDGRGLSTASGNYQHLQHGLVVSLRYDSL